MLFRIFASDVYERTDELRYDSRCGTGVDRTGRSPTNGGDSVVLTAARRRMNDALDAPTSVLVVGSSADARALAERFAESYAVTFVTERGRLAGHTANGVVIHEAPLDDAGALGALDLTADVAVVTTARDQTNLLVTQALRLRSDVGRIVVRVNDPDRGDLFTALGAETVCPTAALAPAFETALEGT